MRGKEFNPSLFSSLVRLAIKVLRTGRLSLFFPGPKGPRVQVSQLPPSSTPGPLANPPYPVHHRPRKASGRLLSYGDCTVTLSFPSLSRYPPPLLLPLPRPCPRLFFHCEEGTNYDVIWSLWSLSRTANPSTRHGKPLIAKVPE